MSVLKLKKLRYECLSLRHRLWKLGYKEAYLRNFFTTVEVASQFKRKEVSIDGQP